MPAEKAAQEEALAPVRMVTISEVKAIIEREQHSRGAENLTYEQKLALDHADHFVKLSPQKAAELAKKLQALGGRVNEYYAFRITDLLPVHADDVRAIFARDRSGPDNDEMEKILAVVRDYL
ncbi:MAG: RNA polymerase Rpb4 family protein [Candidatus Thermoplasmatota archaeon]